jgi:hypothetical protein
MSSAIAVHSSCVDRTLYEWANQFVPGSGVGPKGFAIAWALSSYNIVRLD